MEKTDKDKFAQASAEVVQILKDNGFEGQARSFEAVVNYTFKAIPARKAPALFKEDVKFLNEAMIPQLQRAIENQDEKQRQKAIELVVDSSIATMEQNFSDVMDAKIAPVKTSKGKGR